MWDEIEDVVIAIPELKLEKAFNPEIKIKDKYMGKRKFQLFIEVAVCSGI